MTSAPFMQLYIADYLGDTQHLTTEQHGAYLLLLMTMWRAGGSLPNDPVKLARIVRMSPSRWARVGVEVMALFDTEGVVITQKRLAVELEKAKKKSESRATAGAEGGKAKSLKDKEAAVANATVLPRHSPDTREQSSEAKASGAPAPPADPIERLWFEGVPSMRAMGANDREARGNIGRWLKTNRPDDVLGAIQRARDMGTRDPIPLVSRLLNPIERPSDARKGNSISAEARKLARELREPEQWAEFDLPAIGRG